jgi:hypothetical protein
MTYHDPKELEDQEDNVNSDNKGEDNEQEDPPLDTDDDAEAVQNLQIIERPSNNVRLS